MVSTFANELIILPPNYDLIYTRCISVCSKKSFLFTLDKLEFKLVTLVGSYAVSSTEYGQMASNPNITKTMVAILPKSHLAHFSRRPIMADMYREQF